MSAAKKLPKGLPPLPPVPEGWYAWELCGWGGLTTEADGTPWGCSNDSWGDWGVDELSKFPALGLPGFYYIRAIKRPAAKKANGKRVKALKLWSRKELEPTPVFSRKRFLPKDRAYLVHPADAASVERMVVDAAAAIAKMPRRSCNDELARAALAAIGITAPKKGGRK